MARPPSEDSAAAGSEMKRCFVISPIGPEGSDIRQHADDVFDFIIKPAMTECGIEALRSDHILEPGKITDQMFHELMTDMCVAIVTSRHNPNVYYELAIAQAAARPVIILVEKGTELPFDVEHLRCVEYDLSLRPVIEGTYRDHIVDHVRHFESRGWQVEAPFGAATALSLEGRQSPGLRFFETAGGYESLDEWAHSIERTTERFALLHAVPLGWKRTDEIRRLYLQKAEDGCRIQFLTMHPENPGMAGLFPAGVSQVTLDAARAELDAVNAFFSELALASPNIEFRQLRAAVPMCEITMLDGFAMYVPYLHAEQHNYLPLWEVGSGHALYNVLMRELEALWKAGAAPTGSAPAVPVDSGQ